MACLHVVFSGVFPVSNTWTLDIVSHVEPTHVIIMFCLSNFADNPGLSTWLIFASDVLISSLKQSLPWCIIPTLIIFGTKHAYVDNV